MNTITNHTSAAAPAPTSHDRPLRPPAGSSEPSSHQEPQVQELKSRDQAVRAHEQAHKSAGGSYAGAISYSYTTGPDGHRYATGGEVPIDVAPVEGDPAATIQKMQQVRRAALAPADPSAADRQVAAEATRREREAQAEATSTAGAHDHDDEDHALDAYGREPSIAAELGQLIDVRA